MRNYTPGFLDLNEPTSCTDPQQGIFAWLAFVRAWLHACLGVAVDEGYSEQAVALLPAALPPQDLRTGLMSSCSWQYGFGAPASIYRSRRSNRFNRRLGNRVLLSGRRFSDYRKLLPAGLRPHQYLEAACRLLGLNRVVVYGLRYWGNVLLRRAELVCYDHGWWRAPLQSVTQYLPYIRPPNIPAPPITHPTALEKQPLGWA